MSHPLNMAIPERQLDDAAIGPQIDRYRKLARYVTKIEREAGEVRVQFDQRVPDGLLALTLAVEQECCAFVGLDYTSESRVLTLTVANVSQNPRLDSLASLLTPRGSNVTPDAEGETL